MALVRQVPTRNLAYDLLRIASICGVIAIHTFGRLALNPDLRGTASGWIAQLFSNGFIWAVPVFVMLSGALTLGNRSHTDGVLHFYARRAKRIVPALIAWTFIYLVLIRMLLLQEPMSLGKAVTEIVDARVYPHLYFLWLILGLYIVAPVLHSFLAAGGPHRAIVLAIATLGFTLVFFMQPGLLGLFGVERPIRLGALSFWLPYIGYFTMGYALSLFTPKYRWQVLAGIGIVVFGTLTIFQVVFPRSFSLLTAVSPPEYLATIVALLSISVVVAGTSLNGLRLGDRMTRLVVNLSEASFGVFLVHLVILLIPYELLAGFKAATSLPEAVLAYVAIVFGSFMVSLLARRIPGIRLIF